ncbi:MAG: tetratricopeptide repeat protein [Pyrinomonadaceae bacterium]
MKKLVLLTISFVVFASVSFGQTADQIKISNELFKSANARMSAGQYQAAILEWEKFLAIRKDFYGAWYNRGLSYYSLGNYAKAIPDFTEAIRLKPDFVHSWSVRGDAYGFLAKTELQRYAPLAIADYTKAVELDPKAGQVFRKRGELRSELGQYDLAIRDFNGAIFVNPKDAEAHFQRGVARFHKGDLVGCDEDLRKTLALDPQHLLAKQWIEFRKGRDYSKPAGATTQPVNPKPAAASVTPAATVVKPVRTNRPAIRQMSELELRKEILSLVNLTDEPGKYAERLISIFEGSGGDTNKQIAMQPFVIGYFGWKAKAMIRSDVGRFSLPHLESSRVLIGLYDDGANAALAGVIERAAKLPQPNINTLLNGVKATEAEKKSLHDVVFFKYSMGYIGVYDYAKIGTAKFPPREDDKKQWQYFLGVQLGEFAGKMMSWYHVPNWNKYHTELADDLQRMEEHLAKAPAGTPPIIIEKVRRLSTHGNKDFFDEPARLELAASLREALFASFAFAGLGTSVPVATGK